MRKSPAMLDFFDSLRNFIPVRQLSAPSGFWLAGSKTAAGKNRYISLDPITWDVFMHFCNDTKPGQRIFRRPNGSVWNIRNFRTREFYTGLEEIPAAPSAPPATPTITGIYSSLMWGISFAAAPIR